MIILNDLIGSQYRISDVGDIKFLINSPVSMNYKR